MNKKSQQVIKLFTLVLLLAMACTVTAFAAEDETAGETYDVHLGEHYANFDDVVGDSYEPANCTEHGRVVFKCQCETCLNENKTFEMTGENSEDIYDGETLKYDLTKNGHSQAVENSEITKEQTCTEPGEKTYYGCDNCDVESWTEPVKENGHNYKIADYDYATCTADAVTYYECACGDKYTKTGELLEDYPVANNDYDGKAMGHLWKINDEEDDPYYDTDIFSKIIGSTCGEQGEYVTYHICERCLDKPFDRPADEEDVVCGYEEIVDVHSKFWDVMDHDADFHYYYDAIAEKIIAENCTTEAEINTAWYGFADMLDYAFGTADNNVIESHPVQMPDAQPGMMGWICATEIEVDPATCEEGGHITFTCTNENCAFTHTIELNPTGHSFYAEPEQTDEDNAWPTCTSDGSVLVHCAWCDYEEVANVEHPDHGHTYDEEAIFYHQETYFGEVWTEDIEDIATCHPYTVYKYCVGFDATIKLPDYEQFDMSFDCNGVGHDMSDLEALADAGCDCIESYVVDGDDLTDHVKDGEWEVFEEATCCTDGYYKAYCENCGYVFEDTIDATGCEMVAVVTKQVTCTEPGEIVWMCKCKVVDEDGEQVYADDACCDADCENCDANIVEPVPAPGHKWYYGVEPATCTTKQKNIKICTVCGADESTEGDFAHRPGNYDINNLPNGWAIKQPTCTEGGSFRFECVDCHQWQNAELSATGHAWDNENSAYYGDYTILYQGAKEEYFGEYFEDYQPATCLDEEIYFRTCGDCGMPDDVIESGTVDHTYYRENVENDEGDIVSNFVITKNPKCNETGAADYNCLVCGKIFSLELPALDHNISTVWDAEAREYVSECQGGVAWEDAEDYFSAYEQYPEAVEARLVAAIVERLKDTGAATVPGIGCDWSNAVTRNDPEYEISRDGKIVTIDLKDNCAALENPMICVTWSYTMANGSSFSYTRTFEMIPGGDNTFATFNIGRGNMPGATPDAIFVDVIKAEYADAAEEMDFFEVAQISYGFADVV